MAAADLPVQGTKSSPGTVLIWLSKNKSASAPDRSNYKPYMPQWVLNHHDLICKRVNRAVK